MSATGSDVLVSFIDNGLWPLVGVVAIVLLRRPLAVALPALVGRLKNVTFLSVSLELAEVSEATPRWGPSESIDLRGLTPSYAVVDSFSGTLYASIHRMEKFDYLVIDLGSGQSWLSSRVFLFVTVLRELTGMKAVVFVRTSTESDRVFIGVASPDAVSQALARAYPWLGNAWSAALTQMAAPGFLPPIPAPGDADPHPSHAEQAVLVEALRADPVTTATGISQAFLNAIQSPSPGGTTAAGQAAPPAPPGWLQLPDAGPGAAPTWEHTAWLSSVDLWDGALKHAADKGAFVVQHSGDTDDVLARAVLKVPAPYVALVNSSPQSRFLRLLDREQLAAQIATSWAACRDP